MLKMPQARDLITNWIRATQMDDVLKAFDSLNENIREAKKVWEEAARSLDKNGWRKLLEQHPEYQRIIVLDSLRMDLFALWTDKYVLNLATDPDVEGAVGG